MKAIVVDDDEIVLQGLNQVIPWSSLGFETVISAKNGDEAYRRALTSNPDVIITDIRMPVMDGLELSCKIHETLDSVFIIIMSAYEDFQYAKSAMQYGVSDYILKPIDLEKIGQLTQRLRQIREKKRTQKDFICSLYNKKLGESVAQALQKTDVNEMTSFLDRNVFQLASSSSDMKKLCLKLIDILFLHFKTIGVGLENVCPPKEGIFARIVELGSGGEIRGYTESLFRKVFRFLTEEKSNHEEAVASAAKRIVDREYTDSSLSLQCVADRVGITPSRLSVLFRQVFGINFSSYLARLRIEKSQVLLRDVSLKIEDIGSMVGYSDSHYFAKVFKRSVSLTPSEYRNISGGTPYAF